MLACGLRVPGFLKLFLCWCMYVCTFVCVCLLPRLLITSSMIWTPYDWLNKFYSLYMAAIVSIISRRGLTIEARHRNQPNKSKLSLYKPLLCLYKPLLCLYSHLKQLYISNRTKHFSYKGGRGMCGHTRIEAFKEELAWATYKRLRVISNIMLFKTVIPLRN